MKVEDLIRKEKLEQELEEQRKELEGMHTGHRERLRERFEKNGADSLRDHELLELVLGYALPRKNTNELAHLLLGEYGNLQDLFRAEREDLKKIRYMGEGSAWFIRLLSELFRRYAVECYDGPTAMDTPEARIYYFQAFFFGRVRECVYASYLNGNDQVIKTELLFSGTAEAVEIRAEKLVETALNTKGCKKVMLAHNHYHHPFPSYHDITSTGQIYTALTEAKIELADHIIICKNEGYSFMESGALEKIKRGEYPERIK